jgi:hypothetical protein
MSAASSLTKASTVWLPMAAALPSAASFAPEAATASSTESASAMNFSFFATKSVSLASSMRVA